MSATVFLTDPLSDDRRSVECTEARILSNVVWATAADGESEVVIPLENVRGIEGESVDQHVEELESPGGMYTELVTDVA